MICDCHVNVYEDAHILPQHAEIARHARPGSFSLRADPDTVVEAMKGVDRAIVFTIRYGDSIGVEGDDEVTARLVARDPQKFIGFAHVDPRRRDAMELLEHAHRTLGLKGVKTGPIYSGVSLLDHRMEPLYRYCVRHNLPLTMHMGTTYGANAPLRCGMPADVDEIARRHPDLKMIMAHMGHPWYEEAIVVARKHPNVYAEVSALCYRPWQFWNILVCAQEYTIATRNKIFWGTDFPFATVEESIAGLRRVNDQVEGTRLPRVAQETIDAILYSDPLAHWWHGGYPG